MLIFGNFSPTFHLFLSPKWDKDRQDVSSSKPVVVWVLFVFI